MSQGAFCAAHRGLSAVHPENTLAAFQAAVDAGFPALEMDLRMTRDEEVVVLHDAGIDRTTNGSGRVADMRYDELRSYDTGAGPIPRLDDVLGALEHWQGLWDLEIKDRHVMAHTLEILEHHHLGTRAHLSSMDPAALRLAAEAAPDLPRGLIVLGPPDAQDIAEAQATACTWVHVDEAFADGVLLDDLADRGLRIGAWTVNEPGRARELVAQGVSCIITDTQAVLEALADQADPDPWF